jgi:hypothetical protein
MQTHLRPLAALLVLLSLGACASQPLAPLTTSSAGQRGYATEFPANLSRSREQFTEHELRVQQLVGEFSRYPAELDKPHWGVVDAAVSLADEEGKSQSFARAHQDRVQVAGFFAEEGKTIKQKVGGAAQFAAKEKGCEVELHGPTGYALEKSVEKQLQVRSESRSEAVQYLEDNRDRLLEKNVEKLKVQVGNIAEASYLTHVAVRQISRDLQALLAESSKVRGTLEDSVEQAKAVQGDSARSKADIARAAERQKGAEAALSSLDSEVKQAEELQKTMEERVKKLAAAYQQALDSLKEAIAAQAKASEK